MANQPDLVIGDITLDLTIPQYSDVTFSYVVQNIGAAASEYMLCAERQIRSD
jgi:hypothetical protein